MVVCWAVGELVGTDCCVVGALVGVPTGTEVGASVAWDVGAFVSSVG